MHEVLIVDDDPDIRQALVNMLAVAGYGAIAVDDGLEALDYLRTADPPSVILLDLMMPRMDG